MDFPWNCKPTTKSSTYNLPMCIQVELLQEPACQSQNIGQPWLPLCHCVGEPYEYLVYISTSLSNYHNNYSIEWEI